MTLTSGNLEQKNVRDYDIWRQDRSISDRNQDLAYFLKTLARPSGQETRLRKRIRCAGTPCLSKTSMACIAEPPVAGIVMSDTLVI